MKFFGIDPKPFLFIVLISGTDLSSNLNLLDRIASSKVNLRIAKININFTKLDKFLGLTKVKLGKKKVTKSGEINANAPKANLGFGAVINQITRYSNIKKNGILEK